MCLCNFFVSFVKGFSLEMDELQHKGKWETIKEALFEEGCLFFLKQATSLCLKSLICFETVQHLLIGQPLTANAN